MSVPPTNTRFPRPLTAASDAAFSVTVSEPVPFTGESSIRRNSSNKLAHPPGASKQSKLYADQLRDRFGYPMEHGVLSRSVSTKDGELNIAERMQQYARDIGSKLTPEEVQIYINMGERIIHALNARRPGGKLMVPARDGKLYEVKSCLETARAISWYMQAKALMDNASPNRDAVLLNRGTMVMKDEGGKLYDFLSKFAYGRSSSHFNKRSNSERARKENTGLISAVAGAINKVAAQKGIEDILNGFPSGKGTMLFDQLQEGEIFLKWETAGLPNLRNKKSYSSIGAVGRNASHLFKFTKHATNMNKDADWGIRREDVHKGEAEPIFNEFEALVQRAGMLNLFNSPLGGKLWAEEIIKKSKEEGLDLYMTDILRKMEIKYGERHPHSRNNHREIEKIDGLRRQIRDFKERMGAEFGIARKGSEIHARLDTSYLSPIAGLDEVNQTEAASMRAFDEQPPADEPDIVPYIRLASTD